MCIFLDKYDKDGSFERSFYCSLLIRGEKVPIDKGIKGSRGRIKIRSKQLYSLLNKNIDLDKQLALMTYNMRVTHRWE